VRKKLLKNINCPAYMLVCRLSRNAVTIPNLIISRQWNRVVPLCHTRRRCVHRTCRREVSYSPLRLRFSRIESTLGASSTIWYDHFLLISGSVISIHTGTGSDVCFGNTSNSDCSWNICCRFVNDHNTRSRK
jgi:hypothetical protein